MFLAQIGLDQLILEEYTNGDQKHMKYNVGIYNLLVKTGLDPT
jgi:hypothetical protein